MKLLHDIYGLGIRNLSYRYKLQTRLQTDFGGDITFLNQKNKTLTEVVISSEYLNAETVLQSNEELLKNTANILRDDALKKFE